MVDSALGNTPIYIKREESNHYISTILSASAVTSGNIIDVRNLKNLAAFVTRASSANATELEVSPNGSNWWQWKNFPTGAVLSAGDRASLTDAQGQNMAISYVRGHVTTFNAGQPNVVIVLNGLTK